jgi:hypothetical protein
MTTQEKFGYAPDDNEMERASNCYLMSLIALMAAAPLPIINLLATSMYFLGNRKSSWFVRWHCTQALVTQVFLFAMNSCGLYWTLSIIFGSHKVTNAYIGYMITIFFFNVIEFIAFLYTAIRTRKGKHVEWFFYGSFSNVLCKA